MNRNLKKIEILEKIFSSNINTRFKLIPFNIKNNYVGNIKYFPADSKEWKNKVYFFNSNHIKNLPIYDININKLIISYFTMFLKKGVMISTHISHKLRRSSLYKIYISTPEIKHTSSKVIITLYIFNKEHISLLTRLKRTFFLRKEYKEFLFLKKNEYLKRNLHFLVKMTKDFRNLFFQKIRFFVLNKNIMSKYNLYNIYYKNVIKFLLHKELIFIRKYKLKLNVNKYKFKDIFLYKLSKLINKFYNKKVEFNIINLQSIVLNSDIFTEFSKLKLKKKRHKLLGAIHFILAKIKLPEINIIKEKGRKIKNINFNLLENKYKNLNINSILNYNNNLNNTFKEIYESENIERNFIFDSIKYKNIGGIKLEVKGRLTKRYRADRAIYRVKLKGGLKNIDSSFKGLSTINFRGYINSNLEYSMKTAKRRIGAFAVKGWISGK